MECGDCSGLVYDDKPVVHHSKTSNSLSIPLHASCSVTEAAAAADDTVVDGDDSTLSAEGDGSKATKLKLEALDVVFFAVDSHCFVDAGAVVVADAELVD